METEILEIIVKVLSGTASPEEKQRLVMWLGEDKGNIDFFKQSESVWNALEILKPGNEYDADKAFEKFKEKINEKLNETRRSGIYRTIDKIIRIAAILVIVTGISYLILNNQDKSDWKSVAFSDLSTCEVTAPRGSKSQLLLTDGTKVWLNSDSRISCSNELNGEAREVYLEGEGYFEVARVPGSPFIVNTSDLRIRALGTSFNVKSYPEEEIIEATLVEGKIEVESKLSRERVRSVSLEPNQKAVFYKSTESIQKENAVKEDAKTGIPSTKIISKQFVLNEKVDASLAISWKNNVLYFEDEMFQDLAVKLERRFDVNIHFLDQNIRELHFSGKFKDIIFEQVLAALQFASPFYYRIKDKDIYISENPIKYPL